MDCPHFLAQLIRLEELTPYGSLMHLNLTSSNICSTVVQPITF